GGDARPVFPPQDFCRRAGSFDTVAIQFEDIAQIAARVGIVIDYQHTEIRFRLHASSPERVAAWLGRCLRNGRSSTVPAWTAGAAGRMVYSRRQLRLRPARAAREGPTPGDGRL